LCIARGQHFRFKVSIIYNQNILSHNVFVSSTDCSKAAAFLD
jgi:hypothetical protein